MEEHTDAWHAYYEKTLARPHNKRTELAVTLDKNANNVAIDCGCGTGSDVGFLEQSGYQVYGFDVNPEAIAICKKRFYQSPDVNILKSSFESFDYPAASVVIANSSLFFANRNKFEATWNRIKKCIQAGGVFAGDFMGLKDSWASNYRSATTPLSENAVRALFSGFDIVRFSERDEQATTALGRMKHWHTYSVVATKCSSKNS